MKKLVIICVVLASVFIYSEACSCLRIPHPQVQFCNADFVIEARVLRRVETGTSPFQEVYYTVSIHRNYRRETRRRPATRYPTRYRSPFERIYTAHGSASCGVPFQIGRDYIIAGQIRNDRMNAHFCGWNLPTSALTQFQRNALRNGYYRNNCGCSIRDCTRNNRSECRVSRQRECKITTNSPCYRTRSACVSVRGRCRWTSSPCVVL
nr:metalloproteinase inhibitor 3-like [Crassostrea gigas]